MQGGTGWRNFDTIKNGEGNRKSGHEVAKWIKWGPKQAAKRLAKDTRKNKLV